MENQTRFDLDAAIKNWRQEINGQSQLTAENCRELDAHLTDTVRELQKRGLSDEEAFWLARRRVGNTQQVAEEFVKADPSRLWRERVFWMACAVLALSIWQHCASAMLFRTLMDSGSWRVLRLKDWVPDWLVFYMPHWMQEIRNSEFVTLTSFLVWITPFVTVFYLVKKGYWHRTERAIDFLFKSRRRFLLASVILYAVPVAIQMASARLNDGASPIMGLSTILIWDGPLIVLVAWLMPVRNGLKRVALLIQQRRQATELRQF